MKGHLQDDSRDDNLFKFSILSLQTQMVSVEYDHIFP